MLLLHMWLGTFLQEYICCISILALTISGTKPTSAWSLYKILHTLLYNY